jgi:hypothetical protein
MTLQSGFSATGRCNRRYGSAGSAPRFMRVNCKSADAACFPSAAVLPPTQLRSLRQNYGASSGTFLASPVPLTISPSSYPAAAASSSFLPPFAPPPLTPSSIRDAYLRPPLAPHPFAQRPTPSSIPSATNNDLHSRRLHSRRSHIFRRCTLPPRARVDYDLQLLRR